MPTSPDFKRWGLRAAWAPDGYTDDDERALCDEFTAGGCCGCDGAYDDGCPNCDEKKFAEWWAKRLAAKKNRFDRPDVV